MIYSQEREHQEEDLKVSKTCRGQRCQIQDRHVQGRVRSFK